MYKLKIIAKNVLRKKNTNKKTNQQVVYLYLITSFQKNIVYFVVATNFSPCFLFNEKI